MAQAPAGSDISIANSSNNNVYQAHETTVNSLNSQLAWFKNRLVPDHEHDHVNDE